MIPFNVEEEEEEEEEEEYEAPAEESVIMPLLPEDLIPFTKWLQSYQPASVTKNRCKVNYKPSLPQPAQGEPPVEPVSG